MIRRVLVALSLVTACSAAFAETEEDALFWLDRMVAAAKQLNYSGTFTYLSGKRFETMRIAHVSGAEGEIERLETLDGSPREVIRRDGEVRCVLPNEKTVIIDSQARRRAFPGRLPMAVGALGEHYRILKGAVGRVAGRQSQAVMLEPRDNLRYGHHLWADVDSGLLLKARMVDETGEVIEQFTFNEIRIGGQIDAQLLETRFDAGSDWRVVKADGAEAGVQEVNWELRDALPGYRLVSSVRRTVGGRTPEALHLVYSDGLVSISVFVESESDAAAGEPISGFLSAGSIGVYTRSVDGYRLTVLGEAPREALRRVGDGMAVVR